MKLLIAVPVLALAIGAFSEPIPRTPTRVQRDLPTIESVLAGISADVNTLDTDVKAFTGGDTSTVIGDSDTLLAAIQAGTTTVQGTSSLSQDEALSLVSSVQTLNSSIATTVGDLIAKKCALVTAGAGPQTLQALQSQASAASALADAITSKVPSALQQTAAALSAGVAASLQSGVTAFQDTGSCPAPTGGSSAPPSEPSSPPSSAPASTPPSVPTSAPPSPPSSVPSSPASVPISAPTSPPTSTPSVPVIPPPGSSLPSPPPPAATCDHKCAQQKNGLKYLQCAIKKVLLHEV